MKSFLYNIVILLSTMMIFLPALAVLYAFNERTTLSYGIVGLAFIITLLFTQPLKNARIKLRQDVEYDEFGRSKKKGRYEELSKEERNQIDLQKTLDMERIMDSAALKKMTKEGSKNPQEDMDKLIGLVPVKDKMQELVARMQFDTQKRKSNSSKDSKNSKNSDSISGRHMVFYGSPGTGKTTVARILTGFLYQYGYIKKNKCVEIDGNYLKAGSETALKTELVIRQAYDGVLFIDEAYALMESGDVSGEQAIATLIKQMEDNRGRFILILAGYTNEMKQLIKSNPGFESRIKEYLVFPDYNDFEMREIFTLMARENQFVVSAEALDVLDERIAKERLLDSFGNARTIRNILDEAIDKHALNYMKKVISEEDKYRICSCDISKKIKNEHWL